MFLLMIIAGAIMLFFATTWGIQRAQTKEVIVFPLTGLHQQFTAERGKLYSICFVGGGKVTATHEFNITLQSVEGKKNVNVSEIPLKPRFRKNLRMAVEYANFEVPDSGQYNIQLSGIGHLEVYPSMLFMANLILPKVDHTQVEVLIKETTPTWKLITSIIFFVLGVNILLWGIILQMGVFDHVL